MDISPVCAWSVMPRHINPCACGTKCYEILNPFPVKLRANSVVNIFTGLKIVLQHGYIIKFNSHLCNKPWRILTKFMSHNDSIEAFTLPIIVSKNITIKSGEPLCHIQYVPVKIALQTIKGNIINLLFISFFNYYNII